MRNKQLDRSGIVSAWQTIKIDISFLQELDFRTPLSEKSLSSTGSFVMAETAAQLMQSTSSDMVLVDTPRESKTIQLSDEQIIRLSNHLNFVFHGLSGAFISGYFAIQKKNGESALEYAKRRLSAINPPLLHASNQEDSSLVQEINRWHRMYCTAEKESVERALAETAFYFDAKNDRLIIRHAPVEADTDEKKALAKKRQAAVHKQLLEYLLRNDLLSSEHLPIAHHITPTVIQGLQSNHIILVIEHEETQRVVQLDPFAQIVPWISDLFRESTYYYLGIQSLVNNTDCGRYITILATHVAKLLAEQPNATLESLTLADVKCQALEEAGECKNTYELQQLLEKMFALEKQSEKLRELFLLFKRPNAASGPNETPSVVSLAS